MCHFLPVYYLGIVFLGRVEGQNITLVKALLHRTCFLLSPFWCNSPWYIHYCLPQVLLASKLASILENSSLQKLSIEFIIGRPVHLPKSTELLQVLCSLMRGMLGSIILFKYDVSSKGGPLLFDPRFKVLSQQVYPLFQPSGPSRMARDSSMNKIFHKCWLVKGFIFCPFQTLLFVYFYQWWRCHWSHWCPDLFQKRASCGSRNSFVSNAPEKFSRGQTWFIHSLT